MALLLLCGAGTFPGWSTEGKAVRVGPSLDEEIVALFIAPTRSDKPFVSTDSTLYAYDAKGDGWTPVFRLLPGLSRVLAVEGYAKSSKVLYVAHTDGVSRTGDKGETWVESVPVGYRGDPVVNLRVNPVNREEALLATQDTLWRTRDYGERWTRLQTPWKDVRISGLAWSGGVRPIALVATADGLYLSVDAGSRWQRYTLPSSNISMLADASSLAVSATAMEDTWLIRAFDLNSPTRFFQEPLSLAQSPRMMAVDSEGRGVLWFAADNRIYVSSLQEPARAPVAIHETKKTIRNLSAHPRQASAIYWSEGGQLMRLDGGFGPFSNKLKEHLGAERFAEAEIAAVAAAAQDEPRAMAMAVVDDVAGSEPSARVAVAAALDYAGYDAKDMDSWRRNVRRRNWLPRLSVSVGRRDDGLRRYGLIRNTDRFGITRVGDLRRDEEIKNLDQAEIEVRWDLRELLFSGDQLDLSEEARRRSRYRNDLIQSVIELYYGRLQLLLDERLHGKEFSPDEAIRLHLEIVEQTDLLNQLCGDTIFKARADSNDGGNRASSEMMKTLEEDGQ